MNIFEIAAIQKFRFPTIKGEVTAEALWDMPLQSKNQFDLDDVAKTVNAALKSVTEESFVVTKVSPAKDKLTTMLEVVKYIIAAKLKAEDDARVRASKLTERGKLLDVLEAKQNAALASLSEEELKAKLAALE